MHGLVPVRVVVVAEIVALGVAAVTAEHLLNLNQVVGAIQAVIAKGLSQHNKEQAVAMAVAVQAVAKGVQENNMNEN